MKALEETRNKVMLSFLPEDLKRKQNTTIHVKVPMQKEPEMDITKIIPIFDKEKEHRRLFSETKFKMAKATNKVKILKKVKMIVNRNDEEDEDFSPLKQKFARPSTFVPGSLVQTGLFEKGCLTCGRENIIVKYHGERHICIPCRRFIKDENNRPVTLFVAENGSIRAIAWKPGPPGGPDKIYYDVPSDRIKVFEYRCYSTFSGPNEMIVLLHDIQSWA